MKDEGSFSCLLVRLDKAPYEVELLTEFARRFCGTFDNVDHKPVASFNACDLGRLIAKAADIAGIATTSHVVICEDPSNPPQTSVRVRRLGPEISSRVGSRSVQITSFGWLLAYGLAEAKCRLLILLRENDGLAQAVIGSDPVTSWSIPMDDRLRAALPALLAGDNGASRSSPSSGSVNAVIDFFRSAQGFLDLNQLVLVNPDGPVEENLRAEFPELPIRALDPDQLAKVLWSGAKKLAYAQHSERDVTVRAANDAVEIVAKVRRKLSYRMNIVDKPVFSGARPVFDRAIGRREGLMLIDSGLGKRHVAEALAYAQKSDTIVARVLPAGEPCKTIDAAVELCDLAYKLGLPRGAFFIAVGGGALLDLVGFAASIYRRGVSCIRVPTTLIAQIDVAVGIKQGVNRQTKKNAIGSFYPVQDAIIYPGYLQNLPRAEICCGIAEIFKIALVASEPLYRILREHGPRLIDSNLSLDDPWSRKLIELSCRVMAEELNGNLFESNLARLPDFGHTIGPSIELTLGLRHGESVAIDMAFCVCLAAIKGFISEELRDEILADMRALSLPLWDDRIEIEDIENAMDSCVRHRDGALNLVVPTGIGRASFIRGRDEVSLANLNAALRVLLDRTTGIQGRAMRFHRQTSIAP